MVTKTRQTFGERLRSLRTKAGLTQQQLAQAAGISLSIVAQMEQGGRADPKLSTLYAVAEALGVTVGQLVGERK